MMPVTSELTTIRLHDHVGGVFVAVRTLLLLCQLGYLVESDSGCMH
jgi:hypothetical protein